MCYSVYIMWKKNTRIRTNGPVNSKLNSSEMVSKVDKKKEKANPVLRVTGGGVQNLAFYFDRVE